MSGRATACSRNLGEKLWKRSEHGRMTQASDAFVEYKPQAIALHVRAIAMRDPERAEYLMREADTLAKGLGLHVRRGKALREAEVVPSDKGRALAEILERSGARSVFFVGDDLTDFPAIELATQRGVGAFVRSTEQRGTPARSAEVLDGVGEVAEVLAEASDAPSAAERWRVHASVIDARHAEA